MNGTYNTSVAMHGVKHKPWFIVHSLQALNYCHNSLIQQQI